MRMTWWYAAILGGFSAWASEKIMEIACEFTHHVNECVTQVVPVEDTQ